jgi:hypothetical protein
MKLSALPHENSHPTRSHFTSVSPHPHPNPSHASSSPRDARLPPLIELPKNDTTVSVTPRLENIARFIQAIAGQLWSI